MSSKERFLYIAIVFFGAYYLINMYSSNEEEYINKYNRNANFENKYKKFIFRFRQVYNLPKKIVRIIRK